MSEAILHELVGVSHSRLVSKTIELNDDTASIQVYKDSFVLTVGNPVLRKKQAFSMELGPWSTYCAAQGICTQGHPWCVGVDTLDLPAPGDHVPR